MDKPEIDKEYAIEEAITRWGKVLGHEFIQFVVPTEMVIKSVEDMARIPVMGRAYRTEFRVAPTGVVMNYDELRRAALGVIKVEQNLWWGCPHIFMQEIFTDHGNDGHTEMFLSFYKFIAVDHRGKEIKFDER